MPFKLSATLTGHSSDVRAVSAPQNDLVLSASRDTTAISWQKSNDGPGFSPANVFRASSRYVNAISYVPPTPDAPKGYVVTGGQDSTINVYRLHDPRDEPDYTLLGHQENVCALAVSAGGTIVSGSWDRTAKVWKDFRLVHDLKGHEQSVWAVLAVDEDQVLTGSADNTIKLWQEHKALHTFTGHTQAVRGLVLIPDIGFASCSNDSEIRVWTLGGDTVYTLSGHTSFVYSLAVLPNGDLVSGGEDRTVRVWQDGECKQTIVHPAISVWAVASMPNGDVVSGCSDGVVRVFSESEERWASEADLKEYQDLVASQALPSQQVGDVKKSDLPGVEALSTPGKKPGEVKMIKNGESVEAHQWDSASGSWQKIGDVVDAVGQGRKQLYQGKEYDYVFDVDIQDGVPPLKLPYNVSENPFSAAQRFLNANELPLSYIDEVVGFIEKNTAGVKLGATGAEYVDPYTGASRYQSSAASVPTNAPGTYQDPFTGASRYRSSAASVPTSTPATYQDPFTGASRYVAQTQSSATAPSSGFVDPFTGASRYSGADTAAPAAPAVLPITKFVYFKQANVTAMQGKFQQFDDALRNEISTSTFAMYPEERRAVEEAFAFLKTATSSTAPISSPLNDSHLDAVIHILTRWPSSQLFPVIDLSRLILGFSPEIFKASNLREQFFDALFKACEWTDNWPSTLSKTHETNILLLFRTIANAFHEGDTVGPWVAQLLTSLRKIPYAILNKNQRVALATVIFNISCVIAFKASVDDEIRTGHVLSALQVIESESTEPEAMYRALVALGNAIVGYKQRGVALDQKAEIVHRVRNASQFNEDRIKNLVNEIQRQL